MGRVNTCFFERDPRLAIERRAVAEGVGTLLLMLAAAGAGVTSQRLMPQDPELALIAVAIATAGALASLIVAFGPVSGGHFNPLITGLQFLGGDRTPACTLTYVTAQIIGAVLGAMLATMIFGPTGPHAPHPVANSTFAASEIAASAGLMIVVFGCARGGRTDTGPFAVSAWLAAAIIATPSTSFANPAIVLAALLAPGPIALPVGTVLLYIPAEIAGALLAFIVIVIAYPRHRFIEPPKAAPTMAVKESVS